MSEQVLELDGSVGEGGGQILRTSLALSLLTGKPFHLRNVRAGRPKPGLRPQHLMSVRAAAQIGKAEVVAVQGGSEVVFTPGPVSAGRYFFNIGTAGSTGLVLHTVYLPLLLRTTQPSTVVLTGGTHVDTSPCFHFLDVTWRAYLELLGLKVSLRLMRPGFYPRGGGVIEAHLQPAGLPRGLRALERGEVQVSGFSAVAGLPEDIAARQARQATKRLRQQGLTAALREESWDGGPGTVVGLTLHTAPAPVFVFALGARGKRAEKVADEAVELALAYRDAAPAAVDEHSADQLVLPLALAEGASEFSVARVTRHLTTNLGVIRRFLDRDLTCEGEEGGPGVVRVPA